MNQLPFEKIKRKILTKKEAKTDAKLGCKPEKRTTEEIITYGVVNVNKCQGPTSHQISDFVQKILHIDKSGHSGTLDPHVHGALPVALGRSTRIVQTLLKSGKEYVGIMHLHKDVGEAKLKEIIKKNFTGKIKQIPPLKSSVKRVKREREIYYFDILEKDGQDVLFVVGCEAGTYIRKLCLHPKTEITTTSSLVSAEDFFINPQKIFSMVNKKISQQTPSEVQKFPFKGNLYKITMDSGISFLVTPEHRMLVSTDKGYAMKQTNKLKTSDYIVKSGKYFAPEIEIPITDLLDDKYLVDQEEIRREVKNAFIKQFGSIREMNRRLKLDRKPFLKKSKHAIPLGHVKKSGIYENIKHKIHSFKSEKGIKVLLKELTPDIMYLAGLIASDGNNTKEKGTIRYTRIKFHNKNQHLIEMFENKYRKIFPNFNLTKSLMQNGITQLDSTNSFFATICANFGIKSPQKKSNLSRILLLEKRLIAAFLKGYFDGDGTAYFKKKTKKKGHHTRIDFFTVNGNDAIVLHKMLLKLNISNKIFKKLNIFVVSVNDMASKKRYCQFIGTSHPRKKEKLNEICNLESEDLGNGHYLGFHFKKQIVENKSRLHRMGGNLNRVLKGTIPITRGFYKKASKIVKLPLPDDFVIEKIKTIKEVNGTNYVYDMTVPDTHNFLIETGFVSSNCHDLGQKLKIGAHMQELRRTKAGPFNEETLFTLQDLTDAYHFYKKEGNDKFIRKVIQPVENAISHLPKIWVFDTTVDTLCHGADLNVPGISKLNDYIYAEDNVAIMTLKGELVALGVATMSSDDILKKSKGLAVKTDKVFMEPGVYRL
jgi:tRNA pseudouridine(55) synthase